MTNNWNKTFDKEGMRAYKSLKAFKYFDSGYVQKISSVNVDDFFVIQAEILASMTAKHYKVFVCLSSKGDVQGGSCDCVAGFVI
ncbi:hypothetical protein KUTeg_009216 [Tegillarca granosa]|uniref:Uncharacterized protein n=2 Tax=Tegillarca granosa TaxID=220873 RepID=A0ABQ9F775_TEGGR|nr:hypothetical protein KUTeg_009216 [Tegillarca granosa]